MNSQNEPKPSAQLDLAEEIHALTAYLKKINKPHRRFWTGVLAGLGGVIGASILAAPFLYLVSVLLKLFGIESLLL